MGRRNTRRPRGTNFPNSVESLTTMTPSCIEQFDSTRGLMPPQTLPFLLDNCRNLNLYKLVRFWSDPTACAYTRGEMAKNAAGASCFIGMHYLNLGKIFEARALALNGCFLYQCLVTPIEAIVELCGENFSNPVKGYELPIFTRGFQAIQTPKVLKRLLQSGLPECRSLMSSFDQLRSADETMDYVGSISDDWKSSSTGNRQRTSSRASDGAQIRLVLVDDTNDGRRHSLDVGSSTALKAVFNRYADERGVSLRSLRFSYRGETLFLSGVGKRTPNELNMNDRDVIRVIDTSAPARESSGCSSDRTKKGKKEGSKKVSGPRARRRGRAPAPNGEPAKTLEEFRARHSQMLTSLHEELEPRLRKIRNRLNALGLERRPPKQKKKNRRKAKTEEGTDGRALSDPGSEGAKVGKPRFLIQVGEVENLYKTNKARHLGRPGASATLDLHGYSKDQALNTLNERLPKWVETAMSGQYPWVMPVQIICGCGSQILSAAVQEWIKSTRNVSNAPKTSIR